MDEFRRCHVPAFGSWNSSEEVEFSECFEAARQVGLFPTYGYYGDRDLYVAGDLYGGYDVVTPAVIVVPRRRTKSQYPRVIESKKKIVKEPTSPVSTLSPLSSPPMKKSYKPVDEDLYKISPELLHIKPKRKRGWGIFSSCLMPCAA